MTGIRRVHIGFLMVTLLSASLALTRVASPGRAQTAPAASPVAGSLAYPAMFTVAADGRIFYAERTTGRIGVRNPADGSDVAFHQLRDLCTTSDQGVYGLALHPRFPTEPALYVYATLRAGDGTCQNQILRVDAPAGGPATTSVLLASPYTGVHIGGRLLFGPDGNLYASTGDGSSGLSDLDASRAQRAKAQDVDDPNGKILRMTPAGTAPVDNPFANTVFAYGFRNVFGFDFDPVTGKLWAVDNGPDPGYPGEPSGPGPAGGCNDEINLVEKGGNYGWGPTATCGEPPEAPRNTNQDGPSPVLPKLNIKAASGTTGARFCSGCGLGPDLEGRLFYVRYSYGTGTSEIRAATLSDDRSEVISDVVVHRPPGTSALSIERGPDGALFYSDSQGIYRLNPGSAPSATALVTSFTPTRLRSDFSGWVGMQLRIGATDLTVSALGRWVVAGNSGTHTVKLVDAASGADVPAGSVSVATAGAAPAAFRHAELTAPVSLRAGATYHLVSLETAGGDAWYDYDTQVVTTGAATNAGVAYGPVGEPGRWVTAGAGGQAFGPVNLLYTTGAATTTPTTGVATTTTSVAPNTTTTVTAPTTTTTAPGNTTSAARGTAVVTSFTPTRLRQDFSGWVGMQVRIGPGDLTVSALGRWVVAGNSGRHSVKLVDAASGADVVGGSVSVATAGAPAGAFRYADLAAPVTLRAGARYHLVSEETAGGDAWYDYDTQVVTTAAASDVGATYATAGGPGGWVTGGGAGHAYGPSSFLYATESSPTTSPTATSTTVRPATSGGGAGTPLVTSFTPPALRRDFSGWVGMQIRVGPTPLTVSALGRWVTAGSTGTHTVKLVDASTGTDVPGGSVTLATANAPGGAFSYVALSSPVTLRAAATYFLVSQETAGGDPWHDYDTRVVTSAGASVAGAVYAFPSSSSGWVTGGGSGQAYGPPNLLYSS